VREALVSAGDPEEIVVPRILHHGPRSAGHGATPRRRHLRHWKMKDWRRRTTRRRRRALELVHPSEEMGTSLGVV
jgi:hypothetical protein